MGKFTGFLLVTVSVFVSLSLGSSATANKIQPAFVNPTASPTPKLSAEIQSVKLDRNEVVIPCPPDKSNIKRENSVCDDDGSVNIKATASNPQNSQFDYYYTVSGGKITGRGANVIWDLTGAREGDYTISVQVGNEYQFSDKTITETIRVRDCDCCYMPCVCPTLSVAGGGEIKAGGTVEFTANLAGGIPGEIIYKWTVSQGEIIEGQGKSKIKVKTTTGMTGTIEATVEISAEDLCLMCQPTASETATIAN
jgi:hypothetical protein